MTYDVIVLGSGPAGFYFSKSAAAYGKKVLMIENDLLGGTGFRTGCLPVKKYLDGLRQARSIEASSQLDWCQASLDKDKLYKHLNQSIDSVEDLMHRQLKEHEIDLIYGEPEIINSQSVLIGGQAYAAEQIVVATGTHTNSILGCQIDEKQLLTHKGMIALETLPASLLIIGGNVEGIEFASYLAGFGVKVTVIAMGDDLLEGTDRDLCEATIDFIRDNGGQFLMNTMVTEILPGQEHVTIKTQDNKTLEADKLLITGARSANIPKGLENLGAILENTCIKVDDHYQTSIDNIYAVGDVNGLHGMAHIAIQQGIQLADYLYAGLDTSRNYESLPRSIFTINEIAGAGLQVCNCEEAHIPYEVKAFDIANTFRGWSKDITYGKVKVIFNEQQEVIGAWMSGENASDYMGTIGLWIDQQVSVDTLKNTLFIHPSIGEGLLDSIIK